MGDIRQIILQINLPHYFPRLAYFHDYPSTQLIQLHFGHPLIYSRWSFVTNLGSKNKLERKQTNSKKNQIRIKNEDGKKNRKTN